MEVRDGRTKNDTKAKERERKRERERERRGMKGDRVGERENLKGR